MHNILLRVDGRYVNITQLALFVGKPRCRSLWAAKAQLHDSLAERAVPGTRCSQSWGGGPEHSVPPWHTGSGGTISSNSGVSWFHPVAISLHLAIARHATEAVLGDYSHILVLLLLDHLFCCTVVQEKPLGILGWKIASRECKRHLLCSYSTVHVPTSRQGTLVPTMPWLQRICSNLLVKSIIASILFPLLLLFLPLGFVFKTTFFRE